MVAASMGTRGGDEHRHALSVHHCAHDATEEGWTAAEDANAPTPKPLFAPPLSAPRGAPASTCTYTTLQRTLRPVETLQPQTNAPHRPHVVVMSFYGRGALNQVACWLPPIQQVPGPFGGAARNNNLLPQYRLRTRCPPTPPAPPTPQSCFHSFISASEVALCSPAALAHRARGLYCCNDGRHEGRH